MGARSDLAVASLPHTGQRIIHGGDDLAFAEDNGAVDNLVERNLIASMQEDPQVVGYAITLFCGPSSTVNLLQKLEATLHRPWAPRADRAPAAAAGCSRRRAGSR